MTDETEATANLTTSAGLEGANNSTIVQNPETKTNEVVSPEPVPPAGATGGNVETLDKIEAEVVTPIAQAEVSTVKSAEQALAEAKAHASTLFAFFQNVGGVASVDLQALEAHLTNLMGAVEHLFKF